MSFNRINYDECAYDLQMGRSTNPGSYRLFGLFAENPDQHYSADGPIGSKADVSLVRDKFDLSFKDMADTESMLSWRRQKLNKCNDPPPALDANKLHPKSDSSSALVSEDTRFTFPIDDFRSMSLTPYMVSPYLPINPQCIIQDIDDKVGLNSRLYLKDHYKNPKTKFWDNGSALPKSLCDK
jgi:hypothetical protein